MLDPGGGRRNVRQRSRSRDESVLSVGSSGEPPCRGRSGGVQDWLHSPSPDRSPGDAQEVPGLCNCEWCSNSSSHDEATSGPQSTAAVQQKQRESSYQRRERSRSRDESPEKLSQLELREQRKAVLRAMLKAEPEFPDQSRERHGTDRSSRTGNCRNKSRCESTARSCTDDYGRPLPIPPHDVPQARSSSSMCRSRSHSLETGWADEGVSNTAEVAANFYARRMSRRKADNSVTRQQAVTYTSRQQGKTLALTNGENDARPNDKAAPRTYGGVLVGRGQAGKRQQAGLLALPDAGPPATPEAKRPSEPLSIMDAGKSFPVERRRWHRGRSPRRSRSPRRAVPERAIHWERVYPYDVRQLIFTHKSVSSRFHSGPHRGEEVKKLIRELLDGTTKPQDVPPLLILDWGPGGDKEVIGGNRRLLCLKMYQQEKQKATGCNVQVMMDCETWKPKEEGIPHWLWRKYDEAKTSQDGTRQIEMRNKPFR
mmetsp:Transcript_17521/g.31398  ORF Transcript_17521/g.31398 Transcript_17521/m.31398 type:complete len:483 (+) Transcript_17521:29-1477(+)